MRLRPSLAMTFGLLLLSVAAVLLYGAAEEAWVDGTNYGSEDADCGGVPIHTGPNFVSGQGRDGPNCQEPEDSWPWLVGAGAFSSLGGAVIALSVQRLLAPSKAAQSS